MGKKKKEKWLCPYAGKETFFLPPGNPITLLHQHPIPHQHGLHFLWWVLLCAFEENYLLAFG